MNEKMELEQEQNFRFANRFGEPIPVLVTDEPAPLGEGAGPSPVQLLVASVANCLAASLLFALRKFKQAPDPISASAEATVGRNEEKRLRVQAIKVKLTLGVPGESLQQLDRALGQFEGFCTVTESVRVAVPVEVEVYDSAGKRLK